MATTKTTTPKTAKAKTAPKAIPAATPVAAETEPVKTTKSWGINDEINCTSVTSGELIMIGAKTHNLYRWMDYGDTQAVEYQDLRAEKFNAKSRYIYDPLFVISDEDLLATPEFAAVKDRYNNMLSVDDVYKIFSLDTVSFRKTLESLPVGLRNSVKSIAVTKIEDGTFDSIQKIKIMDEILQTDLFNSYLGGNN